MDPISWTSSDKVNVILCYTNISFYPEALGSAGNSFKGKGYNLWDL